MDDESGSEKKRKPSGILRVDTNNKPRRLSGSSVEFKMQPELLGCEPTSPASSNYAIIASPQLSVRWAAQDQDTSDSRLEQFSEDDQFSGTSPINTKEEAPILSSQQFEQLQPKHRKSPFLSPKRRSRKKLKLSLETSDDLFYRLDKESPIYMEPVSPLDVPELGSEDDDYSVSVSAIMQRRLSTRGSKKRGSKRGSRRASSPIDSLLDKTAKDRRRSSVYTTSSGETAITMEDTNQDSTQEQIFENIRLHKEVLQQVKWQPWSMKRKLRLVQQAKAYIRKHEGELQERFASSRSTRDILTRFKMVLAAWMSQKWQQFRRELANILTLLIPWELRIKEIESHFGSVVASYFTFLRWLFWVNIVILVVLVVFLAVPELLTTDLHSMDRRKRLTIEEKADAVKLQTIWDFEGYLKYSPLFYGYYSEHANPMEKSWYNLPLAYFLTGVAVYIYSFYATLRKMAENSRMSKLSSKDDECTFSWKIFTGWDFMIGHAETAHNRLSSVILGFKEALLEESEKKKDLSWKIIGLRVFVNIVVLALLVSSAAAVILVVYDSRKVSSTDSWWRRNQITLVLSTISFFFPMFFEALGLLEYYHPRQTLRIQLARIMVLNLLNLYSLIIALFGKIMAMSDQSKLLRNVETFAPDVATMSPTSVSEMTSFTTTTDIGTIVAVTAVLSTSLLPQYFMNNNKTPTTVADTQFNDKITTMLGKDFNDMQASSPVPYNPFAHGIPDYTEEQDPVLTTIPSTQSTTTSEPQSIEYDPRLEQYYLLSDEELEQEKANLGRYKRQQVEQKNNDTYLDYTDFQFTKNHTIVFDAENMTESALNFTEFIGNFSEMTYPTNLDYDTENGTATEVFYTEPTAVPTTEFDEKTTTDPDYYFNEEDEVPKVTVKLTPRPTTTMSSTEFMTRALPTTTEISTTTSFSIKHTNKTRDEYEKELRSLCWETMFGQELVKLTVMDLIVTIGSTMLIDFFRALFVRYMNRCWCWDLEKQYPQYGDFKIAENILHLVNNQGLVWMGMFFAPGLALINLIKLGILMYLRSWAVLTCNVPHEVVFRASRSNNFYLALLLTMLFLCVLPVAYAIVLLDPSWHCGPFSNHDKIYYLLTNATVSITPTDAGWILEYLVSPAAVIPLLVLLILVIYYLVSLTGSLREANHDLRNQLRKERTEERKKMWKLAEEQTKGPTNGSNVLSARWKKVLEGTQSPSPENPAAGGTTGDTKVEARKELLARIMKKALRKGSATSDEDSQATNIGDETDTEMQESLPHDQQPAKTATKSKMKMKNPFAQIIALAKEKAAHEEAQKTTVPDAVEAQENKENIRKESQGEINRTPQKTEEEEAEEKERVVSERRRSLLKRQDNVDPGKKTGTSSSKYEQVNEKKKGDKHAPDLVFKFDESLANQSGEKTEGKKVKPEKPKRNGAHARHRCSPHHEMSDSSTEYPSQDTGTIKRRDPKTGKSDETPHYAAPMKIKPIVEKPVEQGPVGKYEKKTEDAIEKAEDKEKDVKPTEEPKVSPAKPKRKFNTFFTIKKDGATGKDEGGRSPKSPRSPISPKSPIEPIPEQKEPIPVVEPKPDYRLSRDSTESSKDSLKGTYPRDKKTTKRQDSQTSIWSDNIPVITISKTESDENILGGESGTIKKKKTHKKPST